MLKGGSCNHTGSSFEFLDQLPGIQSVHKVDIAGTTIENGKGQITAVMHVKLGRLLVGIAAILQFKFFHFSSPYACLFRIRCS